MDIKIWTTLSSQWYRKRYWQNSTCLHNKCPTYGLQETYFNISITANKTLNREKLEAILLKWQMKQEWLLSPLLYNIVLDTLDRTVKQEKEIKRIQIGKDEVKLSLFEDNVIVYNRDSRNF